MHVYEIPIFQDAIPVIYPIIDHERKGRNLTRMVVILLGDGVGDSSKGQGFTFIRLIRWHRYVPIVDHVRVLHRITLREGMRHRNTRGWTYRGICRVFVQHTCKILVISHKHRERCI